MHSKKCVNYETTHRQTDKWTWSISVLIPHRMRSPECITACIGACHSPHLVSDSHPAATQQQTDRGHLTSESHSERGANRGANRGAAAQGQGREGRGRAGIASSASGEYSRTAAGEATGGGGRGTGSTRPGPPPRAVRADERGPEHPPPDV